MTLGPARAVHCLAVAVWLLLALVLAPAAVAERFGLVGHTGRWLTDPQGRVVMIHGVQQWGPNGSLPGPLPFGHRAPGALGFGDEDARFLAAHGFNAMRLSLSYWEHAPGQFDDDYLDRFRDFVRVLARAEVYSLLDMQQAIYGPHFAGGEGFPEWMTLTDGVPNQPDAGYPNSYFSNPAMNRAWDRFWENAPASDGAGLQDHFTAGWEHLAQRFAREPGVLGYDVINEPWPGTAWPLCASPGGCPPGGFDEARLTPFYAKVASAVRAADPQHLIVYEPNLMFDFGADTRDGAPGDAGAVFGFHNYCLDFVVPNAPEGCALGEQRVFDQAEAHARRTGDGLLLGEWGGPYTLADMERLTDSADQHLMSWMYWDYAGLVPDPGKPPSDANLNVAKLRLLERPYPQTVAGTPTSIAFDRATKGFEVSYTTTLPDGRPAGALESRIYVPRLHYPDGYSADVEGATVVSPAGACVLRLRASAGATRVRARVTPNRSGATRCEPPRASVRGRRSGTRVEFSWRAVGGDLGVWGFDVQLRRGRRWRELRTETSATSLTLRARHRRPRTIRVRVVDAAGSTGAWQRRTVGPRSTE